MIKSVRDFEKLTWVSYLLLIIVLNWAQRLTNQLDLAPPMYTLGAIITP